MKKILMFVSIGFFVACTPITIPVTPTIVFSPTSTLTPFPLPISTVNLSIISRDNGVQLSKIDAWQTSSFSQVIWNDESTKFYIPSFGFDGALVYDITQFQYKQISLSEFNQQYPLQNPGGIITDKGDCSNLGKEKFAINSDKTLVATGWSYGHKQPSKVVIDLWDLVDKMCLLQFPEYDGGLRTLAFSPSGNYLVFSTDRATYSWSVKKAKITCKIYNEIEAAFFPKRDVIAVVETNEELNYRIGLWDIEKCELIQKYSIGGINPVFSPNGELLVTNDSNHILIVDTKTGELLTELEGHPWHIGTILFSPDGRFLLSGSYGNGAMDTFILWGIKQ